MKKLFVLFFCAFTCITFISCRYGNNRNTDINISENDHYYSMKAYFSKSKTRDVDDYMDRRVGRRSNMSFINTRIDGTLALDDHTTFYIKKSPGRLEIKLDKDENSDDAYRQIKSMCDGIKKLLVK